MTTNSNSIRYKWKEARFTKKIGRKVQWDIDFAGEGTIHHLEPDQARELAAKCWDNAVLAHFRSLHWEGKLDLSTTSKLLEQIYHIMQEYDDLERERAIENGKRAANETRADDHN